jgi:hypothetical protein
MYVDLPGQGADTVLVGFGQAAHGFDECLAVLSQPAP